MRSKDLHSISAVTYPPSLRPEKPPRGGPPPAPKGYRMKTDFIPSPFLPSSPRRAADAGRRTNLGALLRPSLAQEHRQQPQEESAPNELPEAQHGQDHPESHLQAPAEPYPSRGRSQAPGTTRVRPPEEPDPGAQGVQPPPGRETPTEGQGSRPLPMLRGTRNSRPDQVRDLRRKAPSVPKRCQEESQRTGHPSRRPGTVLLTIPRPRMPTSSAESTTEYG